MATISNPWVAKAAVYKGQLHCHSTESDGVDSPANLVTAYKNAGYDFICLTDHNKATADPSVAGILFIPGVEESTDWGHINAINRNANIAGTNPGQYTINRINAGGGLAQINHPNWTTDPWTNAEIKTLIDFGLMEIWNAKVAPNENAEAKYDTCISTPNKRAWCTAVDDCHDVSGSGFNKGWIVVNADELTVSAIMAQITAGNFYASTGAIISSVGLSGSQISVSTPAAGKIEWIGSGGTVLKTTNAATSDTYDITTEADYVRIRITRDSDSLMAWSQPIYIIEDSEADDSYTKALLHFDGADGGVIIEDATKRPVGVYGDVCTKTTAGTYKWISGVYFDGYKDQVILSDSPDFEVGSGDFTIDFWFYPTSVATNKALFSKHEGGVYDEYYCYFSSSGIIRFNATVNGSSWGVNLTSNTAVTVNTLHHLAIVRNGNVWTMYLDGTAVATTTVAGTVPTSNESLWIGANYVGSTKYYYSGYMDEFRFSKGIARWTADFTPPTAAYAPPEPEPPSNTGILFATFI